jgi:hypothetical protein
MLMRNRILQFSLLVILAVLVISDRAAWAAVSQWREDQAANIWLGFTRSLDELPVGLVSSYNIPNPNGMPVLGFFLSRLPGLFWISVFLGSFQAAVVFLLWAIAPAPSKVYWGLACIPLLTSMGLSATSVEFWNQWVMASVNLLFLLWMVCYLRRPTWWMVPLWFALVCFAPAIYLAGGINALVFCLLGLLAIVWKPPARWRDDWWKAVGTSAAAAALTIGLTWTPYFESVSLSRLARIAAGSEVPLWERGLRAADSILRFPLWTTLQWASPSSLAILQNDPAILSPAAAHAIRLAGSLQLLQALLAWGTLLLAPVLWYWKQRSPAKFFELANTEVGRPVGVSAGVVAIAYGLSPLVGGPTWARGERPDQLIQFYPFFLILWFLAPLAFPMPKWPRKIVLAATTVIVVLYAVVNLAGGILVRDSYMRYQGDTLPTADVPLIYKTRLVDFIASDWRAVSDRDTVSVDYSLGGGIWDWVPAFGLKLEEWYPSPMTWGRALDYELLRRYGLRNSQEGIQLRTFGTGRYLVNYAFEPAPQPRGVTCRYYTFGRLRLTIVDR